MVILDKYHDDEELTSVNSHTDAPPSYETLSAAGSGQSNSGPVHLVDEKLSRQPAAQGHSHSSSITSLDGRVSTTTRYGPSSSSSSSSWLPWLPFSSSRTTKQVRQTVLALVRDLVLNDESPESPNLLSSCADACRTYGLDLSALLQAPSIERHSAVYWSVLNHRDALLPALLVHAAPLTQTTVSEIRLACLTASNQRLFQALRCQRAPFTAQMTPLSTSPGADALVLGSMPTDEVTIREIDGQGGFVAEMHINLWQKRMRVCGRVSVEFIARGRIWSLTFFSPLSTTRTPVGMWRVALCLLEHSPPTFVDSRLVIDLPPPPSSNASTCPADVLQSSDLISLSPPPDHRSSSPIRSPPLLSPSLSNKSKSKSKSLQSIEVRLKSTSRIAYRASDSFLSSLDIAFMSQKDWSPPHVEQWTDNDDGGTYTNAIVVPLDDGAGAELLYDNTPFIATDGTLHIRLEARLGKPDSKECVIC